MGLGQLHDIDQQSVPGSTLRAGGWHVQIGCHVDLHAFQDDVGNDNVGSLRQERRIARYPLANSGGEGVQLFRRGAGGDQQLGLEQPVAPCAEVVDGRIG